jgi:CBS domain-containing protein
MAMRRFFECKVGQYMTPNPKTVSADITLHDLYTLFSKFDFNAFPVVDGGHLVGFVTMFDFLKAFGFTTSQMVPNYDALMSLKVAQVMSKSVIHLEDTAPLTRALQQMVETKARSFPVLDADGKLSGILSRKDILRALDESTVADQATV